MDGIKKRGRKKKEVISTEIICDNTKVDSILPKIKQRRGRHRAVINFERVDNSNIDVTDSNKTNILKEEHILHLPIKMDELVLMNTVNSDQNVYNITTILKELPLNYNNFTNTNKLNTEQCCKNCNKKEKIESFDTVSKEGYNEIIKIYNSIPLEYNMIDGIKQITLHKTDVLCWWCCHSFDTYPVCAPINYDTKNKQFKVIGCFCSFNCSKAYLIKELNKAYYAYNTFLYKQLTGKLKNINAAPARSVLNSFGGPLTIEEFRYTFDTLSYIKSNIYPLVYMPTQIEYHKIDKEIQESIDRLSISKQQKIKLTRKSISEASKRLSIKKNSSISNTNTNSLLSIINLIESD